MKKIMTTLLAIAMILSLAACGGSGGGSSSSGSSGSSGSTDETYELKVSTTQTQTCTDVFSLNSIGVFS